MGNGKEPFAFFTGGRPTFGLLLALLEGIDRIYLNVYVPRLQYEQGIVGFFRAHREQVDQSTANISLVDA